MKSGRNTGPRSECGSQTHPAGCGLTSLEMGEAELGIHLIPKSAEFTRFWANVLPEIDQCWAKVGRLNDDY